jgi:hypothetical protein
VAARAPTPHRTQAEATPPRRLQAWNSNKRQQQPRCCDTRNAMHDCQRYMQRCSRVGTQHDHSTQLAESTLMPAPLRSLHIHMHSYMLAHSRKLKAAVKYSSFNFKHRNAHACRSQTKDSARTRRQQHTEHRFYAQRQSCT